MHLAADFEKYFDKRRGLASKQLPDTILPLSRGSFFHL